MIGIIEAFAQLPLPEGTHSIRLVARGDVKLDSIRFMLGE